MQILSFQPFSLFRNGGGSRVLRRLYEGRESQVISLAVHEDSASSLSAGDISEVIVTAQPAQRKWMRWHLRSFAKWLRENVFSSSTIKKIRKEAISIPHDIIHVVSQGSLSSALCNNVSIKGKELWVSFHDHYSTASTSFEMTKDLWERAARRLVISPELGYEYQRIFSNKGFEVITDGVDEAELSAPNTDSSNFITVYFAGLLHMDYLPLFEVLANALDQLSKEGLCINLMLRGTQQVHFLNNRLFNVDYRSDFVTDQEVKLELDLATILYLPIKFSVPNFYLYSLSTKMISYLGGAGSILYHGPSNSAACKLLQKNSSALCCTSLHCTELLFSFRELLSSSNSVSRNAKALAKTDFNLKRIQKSFWQDL